MEWLKSLVSHTTLAQWLILAALVSLGSSERTNGCGQGTNGFAG